jgi:hypothetical protein
MVLFRHNPHKRFFTRPMTLPRPCDRPFACFPGLANLAVSRNRRSRPEGESLRRQDIEFKSEMV